MIREDFRWSRRDMESKGILRNKPRSWVDEDQVPENREQLSSYSKQKLIFNNIA